jgi:hypothetical protein
MSSVDAIFDAFVGLSSSSEGWDANALNAYSAAVGDTMRVRDDLHMCATLANHGIPLREVVLGDGEALSVLGREGLASIYAAQGAAALEQDLAAIRGRQPLKLRTADRGPRAPPAALPPVREEVEREASPLHAMAAAVAREESVGRAALTPTMPVPITVAAVTLVGAAPAVGAGGDGTWAPAPVASAPVPVRDPADVLKKAAVAQVAGIAALGQAAKAAAIDAGDAERALPLFLQELGRVASAQPPDALLHLRAAARAAATHEGEGKRATGMELSPSVFARVLSDCGLSWPLPIVALGMMSLGGTIAAGEGSGEADFSAVRLTVGALDAALTELRMPRAFSASAVAGGGGETPSLARAGEASSSRGRYVAAAPLDTLLSALSDCSAIPSTSTRDGVHIFLTEQEVLSLLSRTAIVPDTWVSVEADAAAEAWLASRAGQSSLRAEERRLVADLLAAGVEKGSIISLSGPHHGIVTQAQEIVLRQRAEEYAASLRDSPLAEAGMFWAYVRDSRSHRWPAALEDVLPFDDLRAALPQREGAEYYPMGFEAWLRWRAACRLAKAQGIRGTWSRVQAATPSAVPHRLSKAAPVAVPRPGPSATRRHFVPEPILVLPRTSYFLDHPSPDSPPAGIALHAGASGRAASEEARAGLSGAGFASVLADMGRTQAEDSAREEAERAARADARALEAAREQVDREVAARDAAARAIAAQEAAIREETEAREQAARAQAARVAAVAREQEARELAAREQALREQAAREQAAREQAAREQAALGREAAIREQAAVEAAAAITHAASMQAAAVAAEQARAVAQTVPLSAAPVSAADEAREARFGDLMQRAERSVAALEARAAALSSSGLGRELLGLHLEGELVLEDMAARFAGMSFARTTLRDAAAANSMEEAAALIAAAGAAALRATGADSVLEDMRTAFTPARSAPSPASAPLTPNDLATATGRTLRFGPASSRSDAVLDESILAVCVPTSPLEEALRPAVAAGEAFHPINPSLSDSQKAKLVRLRRESEALADGRPSWLPTGVIHRRRQSAANIHDPAHNPPSPALEGGGHGASLARPGSSPKPKSAAKTTVSLPEVAAAGPDAPQGMPQTPAGGAEGDGQGDGQGEWTVDAILSSEVGKSASRVFRESAYALERPRAQVEADAVSAAALAASAAEAASAAKAASAAEAVSAAEAASAAKAASAAEAVSAAEAASAVKAASAAEAVSAAEAASRVLEAEVLKVEAGNVQREEGLPLAIGVQPAPAAGPNARELLSGVAHAAVSAPEPAEVVEVLRSGRVSAFVRNAMGGVLEAAAVADTPVSSFVRAGLGGALAAASNEATGEVEEADGPDDDRIAAMAARLANLPFAREALKKGLKE